MLLVPLLLHLSLLAFRSVLMLSLRRWRRLEQLGAAGAVGQVIQVQVVACRGLERCNHLRGLIVLLVGWLIARGRRLLLLLLLCRVVEYS